MDTVDASNLLRTRPGASETEVEAACRRTLPVESQAPPAKCGETAIGREALPIELKTSTPQREEPVIEHESLLIKRVSPPIEPVRSPIKRTFGPIERGLSALQPVVGPIASTPSSMKCVPASGEVVSPPGGHLPPVKEVERTPVEAGLTQDRTRSTPKDWQVITGVTFTLLSASALGYFLLRAPDKPKQGKIIVNTVPDGADVWLDGAPRGQTPLILENVTPGDRRLTIKLPGYRNEELAVSVNPGEERSTRIIQLVPSFDPLLSK